MNAGAAWLTLWVLMSPAPLLAQEEGQAPDTSRVKPSSGEGGARIYTTREERREAGLGHRITPWLAVADLVEMEAGTRWNRLLEPSPDTHDREASTTLQLGIETAPWSWAKWEAIFELGHEFAGDPPRGTLDEATADFVAGDFEVEAGRLFVPFGEYFSHFASGPILEFGETRGNSIDVSWVPGRGLDLSAFLYGGKAEKAGAGRSADWGLAVGASPLGALTVGMSYLSDLADAEHGLLANFCDRYAKRVAAVSGYAVMGIDKFEVTAEFVRALESFAELAADRNRPRAWNVELAFFPNLRLDGALRLEGSAEIEDSPRIQAGAALSWRAAKTASVTLEYLQGDFESRLAVAPEKLGGIRRVGAQLSVGF